MSRNEILNLCDKMARAYNAGRKSHSVSVGALTKPLTRNTDEVQNEFCKNQKRLSRATEST